MTPNNTKLVERLTALAAKQRDQRGDMLFYGRADPEIVEAVAVIETCVEALQEARLQLEYLDGKFAPTGTTPAVVARIDAAIERARA